MCKQTNKISDSHKTRLKHEFNKLPQVFLKKRTVIWYKYLAQQAQGTKTIKIEIRLIDASTTAYPLRK